MRVRARGKETSDLRQIDRVTTKARNERKKERKNESAQGRFLVTRSL